MKRPHPRSLITYAALAQSLSAWGQIPITIQNAGFESPAATAPGYSYTTPDWLPNGSSAGGVWNINGFSLGLWTPGAPEGNQVGFLDPSFGGIPALSQTLPASLEAGWQYSLTGYVGDSLHPGYGGNYRISLYAGNVEVAFITGDAPDGQFEPFLLAFDSAGSSQVGQPLSIVLAAGDRNSIVAFDALQLVAVPEPAEVGLAAALMLGGVVLWRRQGLR